MIPRKQRGLKLRWAGLLYLAILGGCGRNDSPDPQPAGLVTSQTRQNVPTDTSVPAATTTLVTSSAASEQSAGGFSLSDLAVENGEGTQPGSRRPEPAPTPDALGSAEQSPATSELSAIVANAPVRDMVDYYDPDSDEKVLKRKFTAKVISNRHFMYHGPYVEYWPDGSQLKAGTYRDGKKEGKWTFWRANGKLAKAGEYIDDQPQGSWVVYREDGTKDREESYNSGAADGTWVGYADDGQTVRWERGYADGKRHGPWIDYSDSGRKLAEANFQFDIQHGLTKKWFDSGQPQIECNFQDGKRQGELTEWNEDGTVKLRQTWEAGQLKK